jgi:hypothetical protein
MSNTKAEGILFKTDKTTETIVFQGENASLEELQKLVGGYIELIYLKDENVLVVNEDGKSNNLDYNELATAEWISKGNNNGEFVVGNALLINLQYID